MPSIAGVNGGTSKLATGLGYFSLGLGAAQLVSPSGVNRLIGVGDDAHSRFWQRVVAAQELSAAAGILGQRRPVQWLWGRSAADVVHLTMLARCWHRRPASPARLAAAIGSVIGTFALDTCASARMTSQPQSTRQGAPVNTKASITVGGAREEVQRSWQEFERSGDPVSRLGPIEVVEVQPGHSTRFRIADPASTGIARFVDAPGNRGTEIHLELDDGASGGRVGEVVKRVSGEDPQQRARDDLRRFKQFAEAGEIVRSDGAPEGHSARSQPTQRAAQPAEPTNP